MSRRAPPPARRWTLQRGVLNEDVHFAGLTISTRARRARLDGRDLDLSRIEFDLLLELCRHQDRVRTAAELIEAVWGSSWPGDGRTLEVTISRLRSKLGESADAPRFITTIRGVGYRLSGQSGDVPASQASTARTPGLDMLVDAHRIITWASDGSLEVLGMRPDELVGKHLYHLVDPAMLGELMEAREVLDSGIPAERTLRVLTRWGYRSIRSIGIPLMRDAEVMGVQVQWIPILETENAVELAYDELLVLRSVTPHRPFLGWDPDALIGTTFMLAASLGDPYDNAVLLELTRETARTGPRISSSIVPLRRADGRIVQAPVTLVVLADQHGKLTGLIGRVVLNDGDNT